MKIFIIEGRKVGSSVELKPPGISIGRELDNDLIIDSEGCSRYHSKVEWTEDGWFLKDLGSTNGTKLNELKIDSPQKLTEGDKIKIGEHVLLFAENFAASSQKSSSDEKTKDTTAPSDSKTLTEEEMAERKRHGERNSFSDYFKIIKPLGDKSSTDKKVLFDKIDFFGSKKDSAQSEQETPGNKKRASMFFYIIVILTAFILVSLFLLAERMRSEKNTVGENKKTAEKIIMPLTVIYEKQISETDNIFRYSLEIKNNKIAVTRDDIKHQIRFSREKELAQENIQELEDAIKQTDFMSLPEQQAGVSSEGIDELKTLIVAFGKNLNSIRIKNAFEPTSFKQVTTILEDFSNTILNIPTISLTAEEMKDLAEKSFYKAEQLFANYQANDENLKESIKRYQLVIDLLDCFEPKPEMYDKAYQQAQEAKKILDEEIASLNKDAIQHFQLQQYEKAREDFRRIKDKTNPDDKKHQKARDYILKIDKLLNSMKKK